MTEKEILDRMKALDQEKEQLARELGEIRSRKKFLCICGAQHMIKSCVAIQTHWHSDDYWNEGELHIVCPVTHHHNRLLFDTSNIPYSKRIMFDYNAEEQFKRIYKPLFSEIIKEYDKPNIAGIRWKNNYYIDKHKARFGIVIP